MTRKTVKKPVKDNKSSVTRPHKSFNYEVGIVKCPHCGNEQGDMGNNVKCEECDFGPMPTWHGR